MAKPRITVPKAARDKVLAEFNHRCARCGADRPQIHHIDENPSNNDLENLIPLCPNCHLSDQHNPTHPIEPKKLSLLRRYKDPTVLGPQFHALFRRLSFLDDAQTADTAAHLEAPASDLVEFVGQLVMGPYYASQIKELVTKPHTFEWDSSPSRALHYQRESDQRYLAQLRAAYDPVHVLAIELLRFQGWHPNSNAT